jgi:hypothetical protein
VSYDCEGEVVFVKQQGAMRTGTNLVKYALEENFTNARVFVNIGRWKHAPADTPFNWQGENWEGDGHVLDVSRRITPRELESFRAAMDAGTVKYAISIRNVYTWVIRCLRFTHWDDDPPLRDICHLPHDEIAATVDQWNVLYRSYLELLQHDAPAMVFRLEDLLMDFGATLDRSRLLWRLNRRHARYVQPERYLRSGVDGERRSELLESSPFDRQQRLAGARLDGLCSSVRALVRDTVDEQVVQAYGYKVV